MPTATLRNGVSIWKWSTDENKQIVESLGYIFDGKGVISSDDTKDADCYVHPITLSQIYLQPRGHWVIYLARPCIMPDAEGATELYEIITSRDRGAQVGGTPVILGEMRNGILGPARAGAPGFRTKTLVEALRGMLTTHGETWEIIDGLNQRVGECPCIHCIAARAVLKQINGGR